MRWTKTKKALEALLADSLREHIQFHVTSYGPGISFTMARAWITWDKHELVNMSNASWLIETYSLEKQLKQINRAAEPANPVRRDGRSLARVEAEEIAAKEGIVSRFQFEESVEAYLGLSIERALRSPDPIIRAIAMLDRRVGKRRLRTMKIDETDRDIVRLFYSLRCRAEGLATLSAR